MSRRVDKHRSTGVTRNLLQGKAGYGPLEKMLYVDTKFWLPDDLLLKADKMTMANSIELRVPFLDHKILEFAARLPRNQKVRGWKMKYLLKKVLAGRVPTKILDRRKVGFPNPAANWLRHDLKDMVGDTLLASKSLSRGYFRKEELEGLMKRNSRSGSYTAEVFSLLVLELWHHAFVDQQQTPLSAMPPGCSPRVSKSSPRPTAVL
jgi:asparagine synthase (glutamine-hydrolysing)